MERFKVGDVAEWVPGASGHLAFSVQPVGGVSQAVFSLVGINVAVWVSQVEVEQDRVLVAFGSGAMEVDFSGQGGLLVEIESDAVSLRWRTAPNVLAYSEAESLTSLTPGLKLPPHLDKLHSHAAANTQRRARRLGGGAS